MLDADPDFKMHGIVSDAPLAHFRRVLGKLIDAERAAAAASAASHSSVPAAAVIRLHDAGAAPG